MPKESDAKKVRHGARVVDPGERRDRGVGPTVNRMDLLKSLEQDRIHLGGTQDATERARLKAQVAAKQKALDS